MALDQRSASKHSSQSLALERVADLCPTPAVHWAARVVKPEVLERVIALGGASALPLPDLCGRLPMHYAARYGNGEAPRGPCGRSGGEGRDGHGGLSIRVVTCTYVCGPGCDLCFSADKQLELILRQLEGRAMLIARDKEGEHLLHTGEHPWACCVRVWVRVCRQTGVPIGAEDASFSVSLS
jgi:hypothetical protein